ncbi:MAG: 4-(cytidine 5'-diphospho)-2-C-methyl-D-erythritol kinase [Planctomycetes bacterium]|nr:4-(cytidine 5'-diphospho)-2-C-methyl-D-erythritol kinase [Planctomycetota bacterium]
MAAPGGAAALVLRCPAKVNLFLEVLARRPDGFHDIDTVMVPWGPADRLAASLEPGGEVALEVAFPGGAPDPAVPAGPGNLAARAARLLLDEAGSRSGVRLVLRKRIPAGAGLGGGSSDAAGALRAVNTLLGQPVGEARLAALALSLGSDVPFFLAGRPARARGRGEILEEVPAAAGFRCTLLHPGAPAPTAEVYARCRPAAAGERRDPGAVLAALAAGDPAALSAACFNRLEGPAREVCPPLAAALDLWRASGAAVHMSGSGSACFIVHSPAGPGQSSPVDLPPGGRVLSEG